MGFKQVYLYDGSPYLCVTGDDGEFKYPDEAWTEIVPPEGIYQPFYFDGEKWIGTSKEEWEANNATEEEPVEPTKNEIMLAAVQKEAMKTSALSTMLVAQLKKTKEDLANCIASGKEKDKRISTLETEVSKLKEELNGDKNNKAPEDINVNVKDDNVDVSAK